MLQLWLQHIIIPCTMRENDLKKNIFFFAVTTSKLISEKWLQGWLVGEADGYRTVIIEKCLKQKWRKDVLRPAHKMLQRTTHYYPMY